mmetsp:Transcript_23683/g.36004  ORF Transcript_23683/g.36004 Transcript_23683/m.36004 type:complete len:85 (-) Transcript_23683:312-566(-)
MIPRYRQPFPHRMKIASSEIGARRNDAVSGAARVVAHVSAGPISVAFDEGAGLLLVARGMSERLSDAVRVLIGKRNFTMKMGCR